MTQQSVTPEQPITPEDIAEAIPKLRLPKPKISSEEAAVMAVNLLSEKPMNDCCPAVLETLQKAYDLPEFIPWAGVGFQGGMSVGTEVCGALSAAVITLGLLAERRLTPPTKRNRKLAGKTCPCLCTGPCLRL